ncbi:MAG TPA: tetratricopeptide repeat protein, partial [Mycobacteriales bacterium]|nr:tetratricopeptide repeat protein [Mycobacteriales bacterium]
MSAGPRPARLARVRWLAQAFLVVGLLGRLLSVVLEEVLGNVLATWLGYGGPALITLLGFTATQVYEARRKKQPVAPEPPTTPLPKFAEPLGRDAVLDQVVELARERGNVLVHGPAGIGTSTVAGQAARRLVPDADADRRTYVDLRGQRPGQAESPARVRTRVLTALGLPLAAARDADAAAAEVARKLGAESRLLLLDNVASADQVGWLPTRVPGAHVLAAGNVRAADLPGFADVAVGALDPAAAVRVLYAASPDRVDEVAGLSADRRTLANWYLGNPSVATWIGIWLASGPDVSIASLLDHLSEAGAADGGDADSAVRGWVYERINQGLSRDSRRLLRLLAVAPVSELSVTTMATYAGWRHRRIRAVLDELEPRSLLQLVRPDRYRIPDPVRAAHVPPAGPLASPRSGPRAAEVRLVGHYADRAAQHVRALTGPASGEQRADAQAWFRLEDTALLELLQRDEPHGRSADLWTIADALDVWFDWEDRLDDRYDAATAMATVAGARGATVAEETALLRLVAVDEMLGRDSDEHMRAARELRGRSRGGPRHARLHEHEGRQLLAAGDQKGAANAFTSARRHRPGRDVVGRVIDLTNLGSALLGQGDPDGARQCADEALVLAQRVGDVAGQAHARELLGLALAARQSYQLAREALERARPLYAELNDTLGQARCLTHLATVRLADPHRTGEDLAAAERALRDSLALRDGHGPRYGIALTYLWLTEVAAAGGDRPAAERHRAAGLAALTDPAAGPGAGSGAGSAEPPPTAELRRRLLTAGIRPAPPGQPPVPPADEPPDEAPGQPPDKAPGQPPGPSAGQPPGP